MSGLFSALSSRFDPGVVPAVRPLAPARFEGGFQEIEETRTQQPSAAPPAQAPPMVAPPDALDAQTTSVANAPRRIDRPPQSTKDQAPEDPRSPPTALQPEPPPEAEPRQQATPSRPHDLQVVHSEREVIREPHATEPVRQEVHHHQQVMTETTHFVNPTTPIETHAAAPAQETTAPEPDRPEPAPTPPASIKIGKIEVRQAPPVAPAAQPVAPKPAAAPRPRAAQGQVKAHPSRLTTYLGWKQ